MKRLKFILSRKEVKKMLQFFSRRRGQKGFTLIELLVVIAIIGILATIVLVSLNTARQKARDTRRVSDLRQVALALEMYYDDNPTAGYPGSSGSNQWTPCGDSNPLETALETDYMASVPCDPGGVTTGYEYWVDSENETYVLNATLEQENNTALDDDLDSTVLGCDCDDSSGGSSGTEYCIQP